MKKPVIGIVASHSPLLKINHPSRTVTHISDEIRQAIIDSGGIPIGILPPTSEIKFVKQDQVSVLPPPWQLLATTFEYSNHLYDQLHLCDGVVFQGGAKVDQYAYRLAHIAYHYKIPALGFCSGQTTMAGIFGDTEMIDVSPKIHRQPTQAQAHDILVVKNSRFHRIVRQETMQVNSRHVYAVKSCPQLETAAIYVDIDGEHIEVLEAPDEDQFYLSTRFHPESIYRENPAAMRIFTAFINAAHFYSESACHV